MKHYLFSADEAQLLGGICMIEWFAELNPSQYRHLVSAYDQGTRVTYGNHASLCGRQAQGSSVRTLSSQRSFINFRIVNFKWNLQAPKQFVAIYGTGSQYKSLGNLLCFQSLSLSGFWHSEAKNILCAPYTVYIHAHKNTCPRDFKLKYANLSIEQHWRMKLKQRSGRYAKKNIHLFIL